jgi:carboxylesterase
MTIGVACLHGLGGTPHSVLPVTAAVHGAGYPTVAPMLPGHGTSPDALSGCTWEQWLDAVDATASELRHRCARIVLVGQSMGGSLALQIASRRDDIVGVATINAIATPPDPDAMDHFDLLLSRGRTMQPAGEPDLRDPHAHDTAYAELPLAALREMARGGGLVHELLPSIEVPVLVISSDNDSVVDPFNSDVLAERLPRADLVRRLHLPKSGHVAALDLDRELLCRELLTWLAMLTDGSAAAG